MLQDPMSYPVSDVDIADTYKLQNNRLNRFISDVKWYICWHCQYIELNYNVDSNTKYSNNKKIQSKALNYNKLWYNSSN